EHGRTEFHRNAAYWTDKIVGNRTRDLETNELLSEAGWHVLRFWEHEDPNEVATAIQQTLRDLKGGG
ncbi:MAG: DUF559 domain-containing protein, partial [Gammaproteobacteria bacterium]